MEKTNSTLTVNKTFLRISFNLKILFVLIILLICVHSHRIRHGNKRQKKDIYTTRSDLSKNIIFNSKESDNSFFNYVNNGSLRRRKWKRRKKAKPDVLSTESTIVQSTIIRLNEDSPLPRHEMVVKTVQPNSKPKVTYFKNYPPYRRRVHYPNTIKPKQKFNNYSRIEIIFSADPGDRNESRRRYDDTYTNWRGLKYGCGCHVFGSGQASCDIVTGQCVCQPNVTGRACDMCIEQHWGLDSGAGCQPCACNPLGSLNGSCDPATGQCYCKLGVGGRYCNTCLPNYFGFSKVGCAKCAKCKQEGHICDQETGKCVCPSLTHGPRCQSCVPNSWGYSKGFGCKACRCDSGGSAKSQCDFETGVCQCRTGFEGEKCDRCAFGYYGFPMCKFCDCNLPGTVDTSCDVKTGRCRCDEKGVCPCKPNVMGGKCQECRSGTFGIQPENPDGCTACFCFGRSASCTQAGLQWRHIRQGRPRTVTIVYDPSPPFKNTLPIDTQEICYVNLAVPGGGEVALNGADRGLNITNNLRTIPGDTEDVEIGVSFLFDTPVYWQLPKQFLGDKVLSYGGFLRLSVETEGGNTPFPAGVLSSYPLVQIQGNNQIILEHFPIFPSSNGVYEVRFHESLWQEKSPNRKVTREMLMIALQNIQHILIRASDAVDFTKVVLKDVSMDTAAVANGLPLAGGVELCECPPQYNSTSCQDPSIGFYRWYNRTISTTATILIQLVGEARPCQCNDRSYTCDIETGYCKECRDNTGGGSCERCADGYYGDPNGSGCSPCPCPTTERNFATSCVVVPGRDVTCSCKTGYTGKYCDRCSYGWFGHPELDNGSCTPCECDPFGSVSDECHEKTGQCNCRPGIEGRDCSVCPAREILTPKGCTTCLEGCTGLLLHDFDNLTLHLNQQMGYMNNGVAAPWPKLFEMENRINQIDDLRSTLRALSTDLDDVSGTNMEHRLKQKAKELYVKSEILNLDSQKLTDRIFTIKQQSEDALEDIKQIQDQLTSAVVNLNYYTHGDNGLVSVSAALMESKRLVEKIRLRNIYEKKEKAEEILDYCTGVLNKVLDFRVNYPEMRVIKEELSALMSKVDELEEHIRRTNEIASRIFAASQKNFELFELTNSKIEHIQKDDAGISELHTESWHLLENSNDLLESTRNNIKNLTDMKQDLRNSSYVLERHEGILYGLNPLYRVKYVKPAQAHAAQLWKKYQLYRDQLNSTRKDTHKALEVVKAYEDIVEALEAAREAAQHASVAANITYRKAYPADNEDSLLEQSSNSKAVSIRLENKASLQSQKVTNMKERLKKQSKAVTDLRDVIKKTETVDNNIKKELQRLEDQNVGKKVNLALDRVESLKTQLGETKTIIEQINNNVATKLRPQLAQLTLDAKELDIEKGRNDIKNSLQSIRRTDDLLNELVYKETQHRQVLRSWNETLFNKLRNLKNQIMEARHTAEGVRLSLSSAWNKGCVRSFKVPTLEPTTASELVIALTLNKTSPNGVLFYLASSTNSDFQAVEVVNGVVRFVWNLGGKIGVVSKALNEDRSNPIQGPQFYKIIVERISYSARLWVLPGGFPAEGIPPASNSSDFTHGRFDISPNDRVWVGGLPGDKPPGLMTSRQGLIGCVHSITLDGRSIGLWNFYTDETDGCVTCKEGAEQMSDDTAFRFNGDGYSVLKHDSRSPHNKYLFSVSMRFRTLDDNALLFLAISVEKDRYVSLTLRDGRVIFQIGYGGEAQLEISTVNKYNDGNWTVVDAGRIFDRKLKIEKGNLKVGSENLNGAPHPPPSQHEIPDLAGAEYLVGGAPPGYSFGSVQLRIPKPFLGCMADLAVVQEGYNPLRGRHYSISPSCTDKAIKMAGFHGSGYLHLEGTPLRRKSAFGLSLRTLQADGLVLLANGAVGSSFNEVDQDELTNNVFMEVPEASKRDSYYSVSLVDGHLEVRLDAGKGPVTLVSRALCNDGRFHAIALSKNGRKLELRVDDELQASSTLPENSTIIKVKDLYLGGVPPKINAVKYVADATPLVGTIKDVLFENTLQRFDKPLSFSKVEIGRLGPEQGVDSVVPSLPRVTSPPPTGCHRPRNYALVPGAVKFGDAPHSYVQVDLRKIRGVFNKNFSIELSFRTFYPNGLLFLTPGTKGKSKHVIYVALRNGQLQLMVKAKRKFEAMSFSKLNDGVWHEVLILREGKRLSMVIDKGKPEKTKLPKKIHVGSTIYLGGLPQNGLLLPENLLLKIESFKGCMRNLRVNNQTEDLVGDKSSHEKVGQCFPNVERGSFLQGDAFAVYKTPFIVESLLEIEIEFRTSEMNGILLSSTDSQGYPTVSLEINNGKIILSGDIGDRRPFHIEQGFTTSYGVCDNQWHKVQVSQVSDELILKVDTQEQKYALQRNDFLLDSTINGPLYIGGLPDRVSGGSLETRENFRGCIRHLLIGGKRIDWLDMDSLHNVMLGSCPVVTHPSS